MLKIIKLRKHSTEFQQNIQFYELIARYSTKIWHKSLTKAPFLKHVPLK